MAKLLKLEEFETATQISFDGISTGMGLAPDSEVHANQENGKSFEAGYQAGWEDANQAVNEEHVKLSTEFSHNLQDLGFTFHEARSHVIESMESLLFALTDTLLPDILAETIGARILEEILPLAEDISDCPIQIVLPPDSLPAVESLISEKYNGPFEFIEEASLGVGQVYLRSGKLEKEIDLEDAIQNIRKAIWALMEDNRKAFANG